MKLLSVLDTTSHIGEKITLFGWIDTKRDHRKIVFLDIRDKTGIVQVVGGEKLKPLTPESVVQIEGKVKNRPANLVNNKIPTGEIEIEAENVTLLSPARPLPLPVNTEGYEIDEEVRLRYRYLDLRRTRMTRNLVLRSKALMFIRNFLTKKSFTEVETPILTKTTPEGARDFLVPSRLKKGQFYALPQSPQQYKQLLMVAGIERYFQIAR
ncbi:hypothetical protein COV58_02500, partial [Candidatus Roizmanbacteria bacterium CG11_big_fil_rev_8_21_14_0_20_36_8]